MDAEHDTLGMALEELERYKKVTLNYVDSSTYEEVFDRLRTPPEVGGWDVFHFIGHGGLNRHTDEGYVVLQEKGGNGGVAISAEDLVALLALKRRLQLVVLNSCSGAESEPGDLFSSTAMKLISAGVPAVVAMQTNISDIAATEFARSFYKYLSAGEPIQKAIRDARIIMKPLFPFECFSPVLYLRSDGQLFTTVP